MLLGSCGFFPGIWGDHCIMLRKQGSTDRPWGPHLYALPSNKRSQNDIPQILKYMRIVLPWKQDRTFETWNFICQWVCWSMQYC